MRPVHLLLIRFSESSSHISSLMNDWFNMKPRHCCYDWFELTTSSTQVKLCLNKSSFCCYSLINIPLSFSLCVSLVEAARQGSGGGSHLLPGQPRTRGDGSEPGAVQRPAGRWGGAFCGSRGPASPGRIRNRTDELVLFCFVLLSSVTCQPSLFFSILAKCLAASSKLLLSLNGKVKAVVPEWNRPLC